MKAAALTADNFWFVVSLFALTLQADSRLLLEPDSWGDEWTCSWRLSRATANNKRWCPDEMRREWAPNGVDRFYNLVRHGYYDQSAIFRIRAGMWARFGINGDPGCLNSGGCVQFPTILGKNLMYAALSPLNLKIPTDVVLNCLSTCGLCQCRTLRCLTIVRIDPFRVDELTFTTS